MGFEGDLISRDGVVLTKSLDDALMLVLMLTRFMLKLFVCLYKVSFPFHGPWYGLEPWNLPQISRNQDRFEKATGRVELEFKISNRELL